MSYLRSDSSKPFRKRSRTSPNTMNDYPSKRKFEPLRVPKPSQPNHILRVVVSDPVYPVNTETLHYLFSQYGIVLRIVLFSKNGLPNGMIEMDSIEGEMFG
jgi:hypothetical protein